MKKFTFLLFSLLAVCSYGQVSIDEDFDSGTPAGWTDTYANTTSQVCAGQSERDNIFTAAGGSMTSPNQVAISNGTDITFSIDYKVVDWSAATVATADGWGTADLQYSTNDGATWITAGTIDDSNDSNSNVCTTFSVTIPGASVPTSSDLRFRVFNTWAAGDYYFYIDNFYANQVAACPAPTDLTIASFNASSATISWTNGASETDWEIAVQADGTGVPASGTAITSNPHFALSLTPSTAYEVYLRADCGGSGTSLWVGPVDFTTLPSSAPSCPATFTSSPDGSCGNFDTPISWDASATADGYRITAGTSTGDNSIFDNVDLGNVTSTTIPSQSPGATYFYTISPYNVVGTTPCTEQSYTTAANACLCVSVPTSIDNNGINNVRVGLDDYPTTAVSYTDHSGPINQLSQGLPLNVEITFVTGFTYDTHIWIDFNDNGDLTDPGELVYSGVSTSANPTTLNASFTVPGSAAVGQHKMRIGTADSGQATPNPCYNGSFGVTLDFDVNISAPACVPAVVNSAVVVPNCAAGTFTVDVDVASVGTATFLVGLAPTPIVVGSNIVGPFPNGALSPNIQVVDITDGSCNFSVGQFINDPCPPDAPAGVTCTTGTSSIVFTEEFDAVGGWTGDINSGNDSWEIPDGATSTNTGADTAFSGANYMNWEASGNNTNSGSIVSPGINLTNAVDGAELAFYMHAYGADMGTLEVGVGTSAAGPFTNEFTWVGDFQTSGADAWVPVGVNLDAYMGQVIYIEFKQTGSGGTNFSGDMSIDLMTVEACGNFCFDPTALAVSNVTSSGAEFAWTANSGETDWEIAIQAAGTGTPGGAGSAITANPYTATGLTGDTAYEAYVRADCGGGSFSLWAGPVNFTTLCSALVPTYIADMSTNVPDSCWEEAGSGEVAAGPGGFGASDWQDDTDYAIGGSNEINLFGNTDREWLISPTFDLSGGSYQLEINVAVSNWNDGFTADTMGSDDEVQLLISEDGGATWTNLTTWNVGNQPALGGTEYIEDLSSYTGNAQFAIWASDGTVDDLEDYDFHVGQFIVRVPPTCPDVAGITIDSNTDTTAEISWTAGGTETDWEVLVQLDGTGSPTTGAAATSSPYSATGLTAETAYEVYVRADCGGGNYGTWIGPVDFTTACAVETAPYTEDFENAGAVPDCWTLGGDENWLFNLTGPNHVGNGGTLSGTTPSGLYYAVIDDSTPDAADAQLLSPLVDLTPLTSPALSFYLISDNEGFSSATLTVSVYDGAAWNTMATLSGNTAGWEEQIIDLGGLTFTGPAQARFSVADSGEFYDDIAIDDVSFLNGPACFDPSGLAINNSGSTTAEIGWASGGATAWEIAVQADGTGIPVGAGTATSSNPYTATGLSTLTAYEVYLRADCGVDGFSAWVGPVDFTTTSNAITTFPYNENFDAGDGGWTADNTANGTWQLGAPANTIINSADSGTDAWVTNLTGAYNANDDSTVTSPPFDMSSLANPVIEISVWYNAEFSWDGMVLQSSINGGVSWQNVGALNDPNNWYNDGTIGGTPGGQQVGWTGRNSTSNGSAGWLAAKNSLIGLGGQSSVIFRVAFGSDGSGQDEGVAFDTVSIYDPLCPDVTGLTIDSFTAETAEISWTAGGIETDWEVVVQADGTGTPGAPGTATTSNPYSATGLTELTAYEVYVRADCGGGEFSAWVGPVDFTTEALCPAVSGLTIDTFNLDSVQVSWTSNGTETDWEIAVQADGTGTPASGTATTNNPHTATGLANNTAYEVYVRANCAANGFSSWVGPVDFTTLCGPLTPDYTADMSLNVPDSCWDEAGSGEVAAGPGGLGASDWRQGTSYGVGSSNGINMFGTTKREWLLSPAFDLSTGGPYQLIVNVAVTDWLSSTNPDTMGSDDQVQLLISTDGGSTWVNLTTWTAADALQPAGTEYTEDLTAETGTVQFAIFASEGTVDDAQDYDFHVGQFEVSAIPACPNVSAIAVSNITTTAADIAWTNNGTTAWEVAVQAQGTGTPGGAGTATTSNPYTATGLTAQSDYEVYVRSDCGGGQLGDWIGPINFSSACNTFTTFPYTEGFESGVPPTCWTSFRGTNGLGTTYDWTTSTTANSGSGAATVRYSTFQGGGDPQDWLVTPAFDLSGLTNPELSFFHRESFTTDYGSELTIRVSTTDTDHASFTTIATYTEFDNTTYQQLVVDLSAYNSDTNVYVAIVWENNDGDTLFVDDVAVYDNVPGTYTYTNGVWTPGTPANDLDDIIIAAGDLVIGADFTCNSMIVNPGASVTVNSGTTLEATTGLTLQSNSTSYSSLIRNGSVIGAMTYDRHINMNGSGSTGSNDLVSAPLTGQAFNVFAAANPNILNNGTLFLFGPLEKVTGQYVNWAATETTTLDPGVGYRSGTTDNGTVTFSGVDNNGIVTNDIQNTGSNNAAWNLVGNPYPSYLNVQNFLLEDVGGLVNFQLFEATTAAIYGYDGSALNGWTVYNLATTTPSTVMAPGQGFFVSADAASTAAYDLEFTPAMRRTGSSDDFIVGRNAELNYVSLKASTASNAFGTDIYFNANASLGFDLGYDAALFGDSTPDFAIYSHLVQDNAGKAMTLQAVNSSDLSDVVIPLGVHANQGEQLTFSIDDMSLPASVNIYLEDVVANTVTLLNNSDYVITPTTALSGTGRFFLRASEDALSNLDNSLDSLNIFALNSSKELVVSGQLLDDKTMLSLYDIQGRLILSTELDSTLLDNRIDVSRFNSGVYVVTVQNNSQEVTKKVIIK
ncbi:T9SS-dependent choice-of-anchor J family protein [Psychroserpens sp.]|uniref:T9SS-dependent choice-of-anchor J family protein n=1 Tax=Psychroserpens sp. TaxID=2020870 RepID=UPI002B264F4B|nr:choice-of-anchor J domain-containing protein [Psychroserpens sp.]